MCWFIFHEIAENEAEAMLNGGGSLAQLAVDRDRLHHGGVRGMIKAYRLFSKRNHLTQLRFPMQIERDIYNGPVGYRFVL